MFNDGMVEIRNADCRQMDLPSQSIQCVVTSPPYWGLRRYSGEQDLIWGDNHCEHEWGEPVLTMKHHAGETNPGLEANWKDRGAADDEGHQTCSLCRGWKGAFGLEPTPELYVSHTIEILREVRRVLRSDGVVFWNIGDSYWGGKGQSGQPMSATTQQERHERGESINQSQHQMEMQTRPQDSKHNNLKPKDLCLIPFRIAIAAQEDGWWVRSVIIWNKPNPMPESVTDRPTESHEYILMLTKSKRYYWDQEAVREPHADTSWATGLRKEGRKELQGPKSEYNAATEEQAFLRGNPRPEAGRNLRSVWTFPTQPYPEAHFAVFPEKLPELCIKAATPEVGCCSECGAPWERVTERESYDIEGWAPARKDPHKEIFGSQSYHRIEGKNVCGKVKVQTLGWQPTCKCKGVEKVPSVVLDPFMGSGTTLWVAKKLSRKAIGYELSEEYCRLALERNRQSVMDLRA